MPLVYLKGDATVPQAKGKKIIAHICNDRGKWGKGFVVALSKRWEEPEADYREWYKRGDAFELGAVRFVNVEPTIWVAKTRACKIIHNTTQTVPMRQTRIPIIWLIAIHVLIKIFCIPWMLDDSHYFARKDLRYR